MNAFTITFSQEEMTRIVQAYQTIQEFLAKALSPNELYHSEFLAGLKASDEDLRTGAMKEIHSLFRGNVFQDDTATH